MIQRIQSLYLLAAAALMAVALLCPFGAVTVGQQSMELRALQLYWLAILLGVAAAVPLATVFMYRNLHLQLSVSCAELVLLAASQVALAVVLIRTSNGMTQTLGECSADMRLPLIFPFISSILVWLAIRGIMKDIGTLNSLERIR